MKANELRIGNLIQDPEDAPYYFAIEQICLGGYFEGYYVVYRNGSIKCLVSELNPIPLAEEWLIRMGFGKKRDGWFEISYDSVHEICVLSINIQSGRASIIEFDNEAALPAYTAIRIEHVHQLQNLYFALTGEELTIKPK